MGLNIGGNLATPVPFRVLFKSAEAINWLGLNKKIVCLSFFLNRRLVSLILPLLDIGSTVVVVSHGHLLCGT